ncbi:MAG: flavin reductase, partial [Clostridia bacterium]|nr:flavin reductase [Clostridia bacterium]
MEQTAMYKLTYGLFVLAVKDGEKDNACIVNTVAMITDSPKRITVYVNKANYTEEILRKTGEFTVSVLTEKAPFEVYKQFGFQSGRTVDKFAGASYPRAENGLYYLPDVSNAVISGKVIDALDYGTHTLFVAEVTEARVLSDDKSATYEYYQTNVKQKPNAAQKPADGEPQKEKWVCKVCGYEHEWPLPEDF